MLFKGGKFGFPFHRTFNATSSGVSVFGKIAFPNLGSDPVLVIPEALFAASAQNGASANVGKGDVQFGQQQVLVDRLRSQ
jgi:hypothetical protein